MTGRDGGGGGGGVSDVVVRSGKRLGVEISQDKL